MNKLWKLYLKMLFWVEKQSLIYSLNHYNKNNLFTYPLLIDLEFNSEKYWNNFLKGISVKNTALSFLDVKMATIERHRKRKNQEIPEDVKDRLINILSIREKRNEIKYYFGKDAFNIT